jgi:hypothetical protein
MNEFIDEIVYGNDFQSFENFSMGEFIDEIVYETTFSNPAFEDLIDLIVDEPTKIQNYHGIRGLTTLRISELWGEDMFFTEEEIEEHKKELTAYFLKKEEHLKYLQSAEYLKNKDIIELDNFVEEIMLDIEKAEYAKKHEKMLIKVSNEIESFLTYDNTNGKLYYLNIKLSQDDDDGIEEYETTLRVFGKINKTIFNFLTKFYKSSTFDIDGLEKFNRNEDEILYCDLILEKISTLFRFIELYKNISSKAAIYVIKALRIATEYEHIDYEDRLIRKNPLDNKQVTFINPQTTRFVKFGKICKDEFYLKDGCMISCFLEIFHIRLATNLKNIKDLEIPNLYKLATGNDFEIGKDDYGITLKEATKWCDRFQFELLAIDFNGKIIFQYTPKTVSKKIIGGNLWRILIHSNHVFNITESLKEFDRIHTRKSVKNETSVQSTLASKNINIELPVNGTNNTKNWPKMRDFEERTYEHIKNYTELVESKNNEFLTRDADSLLKECLINNTEPSNLRLNNGSILSFDVMVYEDLPGLSVDLKGHLKNPLKICKVQSIDNFSNISNQPYDINMIIDKYQQLKFDKYLHELREILTPNNAISTYSNSLFKSFKSYHRGPIVTRLDKTEKYGDFLEIDINRSYTSNMLELDYIPVFSIFDEVFDLPGQSDGQEQKEYVIKSDSFYLIECFNCDMVLLNRRFDFVTGELLQYVNEFVNSFQRIIKYKILGVCTPYKKISIGDTLRNKIKEIYDDITISKQIKKNLVNILYGICNKTRDKKQLGKVFLDEDEAKTNGIYFDIKVNETMNAYVVVKQTAQNLNSGFLAVGRIVLDKQRIKIHKMIMTLRVNGIETYGIRTDALYVENKQANNCSRTVEQIQKSLEIFKINNGEIDYNSIGSLKISKKSNPNLSYRMFYEDDPNANEYPDIEPIEFPNMLLQRKELKDENQMTNKNIIDSKRFEEFNKLFDTNLTIVKGVVGGSGKTYSVLKYYELKKKKVLFVSPYNMLCDDLKKKKVQSITLYKLLGKSLESFETKVVTKAYDIKGIHAIHFEEIYLYSLGEITWILNFIRNPLNRHIKFSAAGDEFQLKPINDSNGYDESYHNFMIHSMFKNCILLKTSKRVTDENEQKQMITLSNELKKNINEKLSIVELKNLGIKFKSLKEAKKEVSFLTSKHVSYLKQTTEEINEFIHNIIVHERGNNGKYFKDQILLGTGKFGTKPNREYKVKSINQILLGAGKIEIENYNGKVKTYDTKKMDCFKYNYANTCHSYQGMSLGDSIYIHNYSFNRVDNRWLYVAITRCSSMNVTIIL